MSRNIILITVDSLRADHLGCYGYERETSPTIDNLADSGHRFTNAFAHSGTTRTSFPAILTSSYALMHGGYDQISANRTLVSEVLSEDGYHTGGFHSNPFLSEEFGYAKGFNTFYDGQETASLLGQLRQGVKRKLNTNGQLFQFLKRTFAATEKHAGVEIGSPYVRADDLTDRAITFLDSSGDEPTFLWTHYMDVHHRYIPPERHQRAFRENPVSDRRSTQLRRKMLESPGDITDEERQTLIDLYDAEIRFTDEQIQRLVDHARSTLGEDTVVLFTADHGEEFGEHGGYSHNTIHDEGIHVPLVVADRSDPAVHDDLVGLLDISPTVIDYAGIDIPDSYLGYSLRKVIEGDSLPRNGIFGNWGEAEPGERQFFFRDHEWKFIRRTDTEELYDLTSEAGEHKQVDNDHPEVVAELSARVDDHAQIVDKTYEKLSAVELDADVEQRLKELGYKDP
jgi:Arylsulfatase A and related enzymes